METTWENELLHKIHSRRHCVCDTRDSRQIFFRCATDRGLISTCLLLGSELCRDKRHISPEDGGQRTEALVLSAKRKHKVSWERGSAAWISKVLRGGEVTVGAQRVSRNWSGRRQREGWQSEAQRIADAKDRRQRPLWESGEGHSEQECMARDEC